MDKCLGFFFRAGRSRMNIGVNAFMVDSLRQTRTGYIGITKRSVHFTTKNPATLQPFSRGYLNKRPSCFLLPHQCVCLTRFYGVEQSKKDSSGSSSELNHGERSSEEESSFAKITIESTVTKQHVSEDIAKTETFSPNEVSESEKVVDESQLTIFQRFKNAYKEYGKVLIGVHVATSVVWFGGFYYAAVISVDIVPLLQKCGAGETIISKFTDSHLGNLAVAYLFYELAKPVRYIVTLAGTRQTIVYLRKRGYMQPMAREDRIRELYKESKEHLKEKRIELKDKLTDDKIKVVYQEHKEQFKEKQDEFRDKLKDVSFSKKKK